MSYVILESSKHASVNWNDVLEEQGYEQWSLDGTKFLVEFAGNIPDWATGETVLSMEEARQQVMEYF